MAEFATTPPIPYVPIADKAAEVRTAVGLSPDTTGNTNLNAILAAGPAASREALKSPKLRQYLAGPNTGVRAFRSRLDRNQTGACLIIGDSTTSSWANSFADALTTRYPNHRVEYRASNTGGTASTLTVKSTGAERQHWRTPVGVTNAVFLASANFRAALTGRYISVEVEVAPNSDASISSGNPTAGINLCGAGSSTGIMFFAMSSTRKLEFYYYDTDGFRTVAATTAAPALVVNTYVRYRVRVDTANGANRTAEFHYSTDQGSTWNLIQSTSVAKATNSDVVSNAVTVGLGRANGNLTAGYKYSFCQIGVGANYEPTLPERIDMFEVGAGATANTMLLEGAPTCYVDVLGVNGASITSSGYFIATLPTHAWNLLRDRYHDFCAISSSHNDTGLVGYHWGAQMDILRSTVISRTPSPGPTFIHLTQNPETGDYYTALSEQHNSRQADIMAYAARKNSPVVDIYQAFLDDGRAVEDVLVSGVDGVHPTTAGYALWADTFWDSAFLDGTND